MNTALLAAPLIVFAIVVLLGFAGCWLDTEGKGGGETTGQTNGTGPDEPPLPYADEVKNANPIAYWRLSDPEGSANAKDEIGAPPLGDHPGTYVGTVTLGLGPGLNDSDLDATPARFDGGGSAGGTGSVEVVHAPEFEMSQFTVEALVHPDSVVGSSDVVGNLSASGGWALSIVPPSPDDHPDIDGYFVAVVTDGSGQGVHQEEFDLAKLGTAWHLAMTFDGTDLTLYVDGAFVDGGPALYAPNTLEPLRIGVGFKGAIQEVAVYDYALTAQQITAHYMANKAPDQNL